MFSCLDVSSVDKFVNGRFQLCASEAYATSGADPHFGQRAHLPLSASRSTSPRRAAGAEPDTAASSLELPLW